MTESESLSFDWLNNEFLTKVVQNQFMCRYDEFKIDSFKVTPASAKGENYLGTLLRVKVSITKGNEVIDQNYVIKTSDGGNCSEELSKELGAYPKEMEMYEKILPAFDTIWKEAEYEVTFAPKCFGVFREPTEIIVLEDLKDSGFVMKDRLVGLNITHASLLVERLAQKNYYVNLFLSFKKALNSWNGFEKIKEIVNSWGIDVYLHGLAAVEPQVTNISCLAHGDIWVNNILFKEDVDYNPSDLRLVDYQLTCVSSPALDLHFLIASCLIDNDRTEHFDTILVLYQKTLEKSLKQLGYSNHIPTLREIQYDMFKRSMIGNCMVVEDLALCFQTRENSITLETISSNTQEAQKSREKLFSNPIYVNVAQKYLKFLYKRGMLDLP